ncbi:hypothetical protein KEH51_18585 [[Brevibacterium] frigoritolerans]|uniref:Uncharacterized protein n=1 Tax=Peribacillus frigoritolerans TaxID=450367 RepID=A0A941J7A1_9BACI|nr:hypothetical protein [Peribacillus frigoritolerans]
MHHIIWWSVGAGTKMEKMISEEFPHVLIHVSPLGSAIGCIPVNRRLGSVGSMKIKAHHY